MASLWQYSNRVIVQIVGLARGWICDLAGLTKLSKDTASRIVNPSGTRVFVNLRWIRSDVVDSGLVKSASERDYIKIRSILTLTQEAI
ncbi:hypothetical protein D3C71_1319580 [compost metagenome]